MTTPIASAASSASQPAVAPVAPARQGVADLAQTLLVGDGLEEKLGMALDNLDDPDSASLLNVQAISAELSLMSGALSGVVHSLNDTAKGVIQNME